MVSPYGLVVAVGKLKFTRACRYRVMSSQASGVDENEFDWFIVRTGADSTIVCMVDVPSDGVYGLG